MATPPGPISSTDMLNLFVPHALGIDYTNKVNPVVVPDTRPGAVKGATVTQDFTDWEICALKLSLTK